MFISHLVEMFDMKKMCQIIVLDVCTRCYATKLNKTVYIILEISKFGKIKDV